LQSSEALLSSKMLAGGVVLGLVAWGAEGIGFYLIVRALEFDVAVPAAIGV
jgi:hypothetical protein